jgi:hypothetical protein
MDHTTPEKRVPLKNLIIFLERHFYCLIFFTNWQCLTSSVVENINVLKNTLTREKNRLMEKCYVISKHRLQNEIVTE